MDDAPSSGPEETFNIEIEDEIYEIDDVDEEDRKQLISGEPVTIPAGAVLSKSGKVMTNGHKIRKGSEKKEDDDGKKNDSKKKQDNKKSLFERRLKTRTEEQQRNVDYLHRHLASLGEKKVVAVRVTTNDAVNTFTEADLRSRVFGKTASGEDSGDVFNLSSGYGQCSYEQLTFVPKDDPENHPTIKNGVITINVDVDADGADDSAVRNAATAKLTSLFGTYQNVADYWMLCLPPGTSGSKFTCTYIYNVALLLTKLTCCCIV